MGIKGLHKALSFCTKKDNLRNYRNAILAVDTSSWMHKSVYSIAEKFVESTDSGVLDRGCVQVSTRYIIRRCKELIEEYEIRAVYLVMDGKRIPLKADESQDRDQKRQQNLSEARSLKKSGQRWKAEDKYKTCIRIKDNFTRAVVKEVKRELSHYGRVHFVNSPHEADSQLTRLVLDGVADAVITEDSDVLVYSAAAHVAFPILFKLDRKTGNCDSINMDWLLSLTPEEAEKAVTSTNTLEVMFRRLAARQAKRKGFGVRLFVQGCILAGCDYRKNIEGIGTTNAFKLVRDNAFRNDSVRFREILKSLPKKVKQKIDIGECEEILAKSEAIFFYHPVLHTDGKVKTLLNPRLSEDETGDEHHYTDHYPFMSRFKDDWSFLGTTSSESNGNVEQPSQESLENEILPVAPAQLPKASQWVQTKKRDRSQLSSSAPLTIVQNPYKKSKPFENFKRVMPLADRNMNTRVSPENRNVAKQQQKSQMGVGAITRYLAKPDVRIARKPLSLTSTGRGNTKRPLSAAGSSFRISTSSLPSKKSPAQSFFLPRLSKKEKSDFFKSTAAESEWQKYDPKLFESKDFTGFSYSPLNKSNSTEHKTIDDKGTENISLEARSDEFQKTNMQDFYDLTSSNSRDSTEEDGVATDGETVSTDAAIKDGAIHVVPSETEGTTAPKRATSDSESVEEPLCAEQAHETERTETMTSKYFRKKTDSRRVTLDSLTKPLRSETSNGVSEQSVLPKSVRSEAITKPGTRKSARTTSSKRSSPNTWMDNFLSRRKRSKSAS